MNLLQASFVRDGQQAVVTLDGGVTLRCDLEGPAEAGRGMAGVRPEHWLVSDSGAVRATVDAVERLGATSYIHATAGSHKLCVEERSGHARRAGDTMPGMVYLFDQEGRTISAAKPVTGHAG